MHFGNTAFAYEKEFKEYMKVEAVVSEDVVDYLFDVRVRKFLSNIKRKCLLDVFKKWDPEYLQFDEDFDNYLDNDHLKDIIRDESMQNLNNDA